MKSSIAISQEVHIKNGIKDSIQQEILDEKRQLMINLPTDYHTSNISYSALYVLDGNEQALLDAIEATHSLRADIIVAFQNTDRKRDMMP